MLSRFIRRLSAVFVVFLVVNVNFAASFSTHIYDENIHTLQILPNGEQLQDAVITLGSEDWIVISFDELSYEAENFYYKIIHCNADWMESGLSPMEYLTGFDQNIIDDYQYSVNTTVNYIHYRLELPNNDVQLNVSGNYAVLIARDNDFEEGVVACACFSVVEPLTKTNIDVIGKTMVELNGRYQQLSVDIDVEPVGARDLMQDFIVVIRQNGRFDNEVVLNHPTFVSGSSIQFANLRELVFEGGNQYRSIDFSSRYTYGSGIDHIEFDNEMYHVVLEPSEVRSGERETYMYDANGRYVVNLQKSDYPDTEADYMWVHFYFPKEFPFLEGEMFIIGEMTENRADGESLMKYDLAGRFYSKTLLLKQGGYNFVYALKNKNNDSLSVVDTEGSYWQSANKYEAFVYYRPFGARYDRLVGYSLNKIQ